MKITAHRSGPKTHPEQTVESALEALSFGADMVEIDCRFTSDRAIAVTHDENLERIFGVKKDIGDVTAAEFKALRHAGNEQYGAYFVEDYLKANIFPLLIHVKDSKTIEPLIELLKKYGCEEKVTLGVTKADDVKKIKSAAPEIKVLAFMPRAEFLNIFLLTEADYIRLWEGWVTESRIAKIKKHGKEVWIMADGCNSDGVGYTDPVNFPVWRDMGVDNVLVNRVDKAFKALGEKR